MSCTSLCATLRAATIHSRSGGLCPFGTPQACRSRHRFSPLELPLPTHLVRGIALSANHGFQRRALFPRGQRSLVAQSRTGRQWEWSRQAGVAVSLSETRSLSCTESASNTTTCAPLLAAPALLDARGFRSPLPVEMSGRGARVRLSLKGPAPRRFPWRARRSAQRTLRCADRGESPFCQHRIKRYRYRVSRRGHGLGILCDAVAERARA